MMENLRALATDGVVLAKEEGNERSIVLLKRNHPPEEGKWVLPGGMVEQGETARDACEREIREEVGMDVDADKFIGLYDEPGRDERGNVSAAYICTPKTENENPSAEEEASQVDTFSPKEISDIEMGFDHYDIVKDAFKSNMVF